MDNGMFLSLKAGLWEADWRSSDYQHELRSVEFGLIQQGFQIAAETTLGDGGSWLTGRFILQLGTHAAPPSLAFLGGWLKAQDGRKLLLTYDNLEVAATEVDQLNALLAPSSNR